MRVYKEPKEIECTICEKMFTKQSNFEDHEKIHVSHYNDIEEVEKEIADLEAEENRNIIIKNFKKLSENPENVNLKEVWNILKKICPKFKTPVPIAKRNF